MRGATPTADIDRALSCAAGQTAFSGEPSYSYEDEAPGDPYGAQSPHEAQSQPYGYSSRRNSAETPRSGAYHSRQASAGTPPLCAGSLYPEPDNMV